jgi:hypothetical protein
VANSRLASPNDSHVMISRSDTDASVLYANESSRHA